MIIDLTTIDSYRRTMNKAYLEIQREYAEHLLDEVDDPTHGTATTLDGMRDYVETVIAYLLEDGVQDADDAVALATYYLARTRIIELQET